MVRLKDEVRHVGIGLLLGLLGLIFGLSWVVYLTANHEQIHARLSQASVSSVEEKSVTVPLAGQGEQVSHDDDHAHSHEGHAEGRSAAGPETAGSSATYAHEDKGVTHGAHSSPVMAVAHGRLAKAHAHAMGLGILSIAVSLLLALIPASPRSKTLAAACVGTGGLFYPLSWIIMGMRTTSLGISGAEASVVPLIGLSVGLVGFGLALTLIYVVRWLFKG